MKKKRLDEILIGRGIAKDKRDAFVRVTEGDIFVEGQKAVSPAQQFAPETPIRVRERSPYVGRGGFKLAAALEAFHIDPTDKVCADIGAATGGFTDVLLQRGAAKVYAIDAGGGKLALKLREDPRVVVMEETNILHLSSLPEPIGLLVADLSFTSLRYLLDVMKKFLAPHAEVVTLFKPQYEVAEHELSHGIVTDRGARERALREFLAYANEHHWEVMNTTESPIPGSKGNIEYLVHLKSL